MKSEIFPETLYVIQGYDVFEVRLVREYNLLGCCRYEGSGRKFDVLASDISSTAFHSKKQAWLKVQLKVIALSEWVELNLSVATGEIPSK